MGSGSCCPQDFRFFTGFFSGAGESLETLSPRIDPPNMLSPSNDWGVMAGVTSSAGSIVSAKRDGYEVPGVEAKLSAKLSTGECSNLMRGVVAMASVIMARR